MSVRPSVAEATTTLPPARDERLIPYCCIAVGGLAAALVAGQPALAALAAPFIIALAIGLRRTTPLRVTARLTLDADQALEGDAVTGRLVLNWVGALDARVLLHRLTGVAVTDPADGAAWTLEGAAGTIELPFTLEAARWGRHAVGEVWLKTASRFGLLSWTGRVLTGPPLRVLPASERLTRLLDPAESHAVLGAHRSRRIGGGQEFAELRPYAPGDRLRDLNWGATARHRRPFVNRHHPELSGDVVIALDALVDASGGATAALARAARAAWAVASVHLQANDRVGIAGFGSTVYWLPPAGGRRAKYRLLETLLDIGGAAAERAPPQRGATMPLVPPSALVVALTPLHDARIVGVLQGWRARGRAVAVVVIDTRDLLGEPAAPSDALARRLWALELEGHRRSLADLGIPVVTVADDGPIAPVVSALRRARRAPALRRGR